MPGVTRARFAASVVLWCLASALTPCILSAQPSNDLSSASLEQLTQMRISVSSFARKDEDLWKTPAAVFIITKEDIARSAVSSIPELLRMVPGMQVAQINASTWAVSARGFNNAAADKLLVLIDGRTVYSEIFSGTQWDEIDLPLEDIERIEVIRGPGAAAWGANAVNGVINIITRKARSTMGLSASNGLSRIGETAEIRYAGALGERTQYRAAASYIGRNAFETGSGQSAFDGENTIRGGGRLDWQKSLSDWITTSGDIYSGHLKQQIIESLAIDAGPNNHEDESISGGHLLSRWEHKFETSDTALQVYYADQSRYYFNSHIRTRSFDAEYQDHFAAGLHSDIVWGSEFRFSNDHLKPAGTTPIPTLLPDYENYLGDGFLQDEIEVIPQHLTATIGSKVQYGTLAGFQVQPTARVLWTPSKLQSLWAAVSRAAVAPSIQDKAVAVDLSLGYVNGLPITGMLRGNPAFKPETVVAYEAGYRRKIGSSLTLDVATFFNNNRRLQSILLLGVAFEPTPAPHIGTKLLYTNGYRANTLGAEASVSWKPVPAVLLQGSYSWMEAQPHIDPGVVGIVDTWNTPRNSSSESASWSFAQRWSANAFLSYVGALPNPLLFSIGPVQLGGTTLIRAYTRVDFHLTRKVGRSLTFDAGGTNLLTPRHFESGDGGFVTPAQVPRSAFVKATWSF